MPTQSKPRSREKIGKVKRNSTVKSVESVKGMADILPKDELFWKTVWNAAQSTAELHDFKFIETPVLELASLFESSLGVSSDITEKHLYTFRTKGGERVALRPEGTTSMVRSYIEHHLGYFSLPLKVFCLGQMFRYERSHANHERTFHAWGVAVLGENDPIYDGEVIVTTLDFLRSLKLKNHTLKISSSGCRVCRSGYRDRLKSYYQSNRSKLCKNCEKHLEKNALRILNCKEKSCLALREGAPIILDFLCQGCNNHLKLVLEFIEDAGVTYEPDPYLVREVDYHNRTIFEIFVPTSEQSLGGGGRYDYLAELIGGRAVPSVGAELHLERIIGAIRAENITFPNKNKLRVFFAAVGEHARKGSFRIMCELRANGIAVVEALGKKSLKAQLRMAEKSGCAIALLFGQREVFEESVIVRDMKSGAQETIMLNKLLETVRRQLRAAA